MCYVSEQLQVVHRQKSLHVLSDKQGHLSQIRLEIQIATCGKDNVFVHVKNAADVLYSLKPVACATSTSMPCVLGTGALGAGNIEGPACGGPGPLPLPPGLPRSPRASLACLTAFILFISEGCPVSGAPLHGCCAPSTSSSAAFSFGQYMLTARE